VDRAGPVAKTTWPTLDQPVVCVYGLRRAADLLRDDAASLRGVGIAFDPLIPAGFLRNMEPDDHGHYKRLFEQALTDDLVEARRPGLEAAAAGALAAMAAMDGDGADPRPHLLRATVTALVPLLLRIEPASPEGRRAAVIYDGMGEFLEFQSEDSEEGRRYRRLATELEAILRHGAAQALDAHRDPEVFSNPASFDPDRFAGRRLSRYEYSPFGRLEHRCIGETLTIELASSFVARLCNGYDWSVVRDGPPEFNRYHWRPSERFRVRLEPRV
jgi:cytochrome P450